MASERSPYRARKINARAYPGWEKRKDPGLGVSSGTNDRALQKDRHSFPPIVAKVHGDYERVPCRVCRKPRFVVDGLPCAGNKS